jgi:hypothetical protein
MRFWTGSAWGDYADAGRGEAAQQQKKKKTSRSRRSRRWAWAAGVLVGLILISAIASSLQKKGTSTSSSSARAGRAQSSSGSRKRRRPLGPQLTAAQLSAVLVPKSAFQKLPGASDGIFDSDSDSYALQGGIPSLKLCNAPIQIPGLRADSFESWESVTVLPGDIYFGSDAASFSGQGAKQLLATAGAQATTCGWRSVPGPRLDDQVVRITTNQPGPEVRRCTTT